jgi:penicillin-binding protein 1B
VEELSLAEGAAIAGLIRAPNLYSPYVDRERCRRRRNDVLDNMLRQGWIDAGEHRRAKAAPVTPFGYRVYGRKAPYFAGYLTEQLRELYPEQALSSLGLSIYTTLDTGVQRSAERALARGLERIEKRRPALAAHPEGRRLQGAIVVMQPKTGYLLALVGGRDYGASQFNRATKALRQPGSAFKPLVVLAGLDRFTPASLLSNRPRTYPGENGEIWRPENISPVPEEELRLREALARSVNLPAVDLAMQIGLETVIATASDLGISTPMKPYPSLALGAFEVIPLELARAYCPFAADGMLPFPLSLKDVVDEKGFVVEGRHTTIRQVATPAKAYLMSSLLQSVVKTGTARSLEKLGITVPVAGKTGTTNEYRDAWFVGYTPDILALVWVGADDGSSIEETGSSAALPIWADLMRQIPQYLSGEWFRRPPGIVEAVVCSESGENAVPGCPHPIRELFLAELPPQKSCPLHSDKNLFQRLYEGIHDAIRKF